MRIKISRDGEARLRHLLWRQRYNYISIINWAEALQILSISEDDNTKYLLTKAMARSDNIILQLQDGATHSILLPGPKYCLTTGISISREKPIKHWLLSPISFFWKKIIKFFTRLWDPTLDHDTDQAISDLADNARGSWDGISYRIRSNPDFIYKLGSLKDKWLDKINNDPNFNVSSIPVNLLNLIPLSRLGSKSFVMKLAQKHPKHLLFTELYDRLPDNLKSDNDIKQALFSDENLIDLVNALEGNGRENISLRNISPGLLDSKDFIMKLIAKPPKNFTFHELYGHLSATLKSDNDIKKILFSDENVEAIASSLGRGAIPIRALPSCLLDSKDFIMKLIPKLPENLMFQLYGHLSATLKSDNDIKKSLFSVQSLAGLADAITRSSIYIRDINRDCLSDKGFVLNLCSAINAQGTVYARHLFNLYAELPLGLQKDKQVLSKFLSLEGISRIFKNSTSGRISDTTKKLFINIYIDKLMSHDLKLHDIPTEFKCEQYFVSGVLSAIKEEGVASRKGIYLDVYRQLPVASEEDKQMLVDLCSIDVIEQALVNDMTLWDKLPESLKKDKDFVLRLLPNIQSYNFENTPFVNWIDWLGSLSDELTSELLEDDFIFPPSIFGFMQKQLFFVKPDDFNRIPKNLKSILYHTYIDLLVSNKSCDKIPDTIWRDKDFVSKALGEINNKFQKTGISKTLLRSYSKLLESADPIPENIIEGFSAKPIVDFFINWLLQDKTNWLKFPRSLKTDQSFVANLIMGLMSYASRNKKQKQQIADCLRSISILIHTSLKDDDVLNEIFSSKKFQKFVPVSQLDIRSSSHSWSASKQKHYLGLIAKDPSYIRLVPEVYSKREGFYKLALERNVRVSLYGHDLNEKSRFEKIDELSKMSPVLLLQGAMFADICTNNAGYPLLIIYKSVLTGTFKKEHYPSFRTTGLQNPWDCLGLYDKKSRGPLLDLIEMKPELFRDIHDRFKNDYEFQYDALARNSNVYEFLPEQARGNLANELVIKGSVPDKITLRQKFKHNFSGNRLVSFLAAHKRYGKHDPRVVSLIQNSLSSDELARLAILATKGTGSTVLQENEHLQTAYYGRNTPMVSDMALVELMKQSCGQNQDLKDYLNIITSPLDSIKPLEQVYRKSFFRSGLPGLYHCTDSAEKFHLIRKSGYIRARLPNSSTNLATSRNSGGRSGAFVSNQMEVRGYGQFGFAFSDKHIALGGQFCMNRTSSCWLGLGCNISLKHVAFMYVPDNYYNEEIIAKGDEPIADVEGVKVPILKLSAATALVSLKKQLISEDFFAQWLFSRGQGTQTESQFDRTRADGAYRSITSPGRT